MKRIALSLGLLAALFSGAGCKKQESENDAIRAGIMQHLSGVGTLKMSAMEVNIRSVSINGNQAHAEVEFRPKTGGAPGAGMHVAYNLEKRDGAWAVQNSEPLGGMIEHPSANQSPHQNQDVHSGGLPNFNEVLNPSGSPAQGTLPPGHPPVNAQQSNAAPVPQEQTPAKKPR